jgi:hypothetical protein
MPNIDDLVPSKSNFLTKEDVGEAGVNLTIKSFSQQEVGMEGAAKELKAIIEWQQADYKPMVLNKENASRLKMICKTADTDAMIGRTVNVYCDPYVKFGNEMKGGIRIRPVEHAQYQAQQPQRPQRVAQQPPQQRQQPKSEPAWQDTPPVEAYGDDDAPY